MTEARHRYFDRRGAVEHRGELVDDEGLRAEDDFVARAEEGLGEQDHHLVGTVTDDEVAGLERPLLREFLAQESAAAVGVEMTLVEGFTGGRESQRRGTEGVLVGGQLDDGRGVESEFAGDDLDGPAGLVDRLRQHRAIGEVGVGGHAWDTHEGECPQGKRPHASSPLASEGPGR